MGPINERRRLSLAEPIDRMIPECRRSYVDGPVPGTTLVALTQQHQALFTNFTNTNLDWGVAK